MFVTCYIAVMLIALVGAIILGLSNGLSGWQTAAVAGAVLVAGQLALLAYVVIRSVFTCPESADRQDTHRDDPGHHPAHSE